MDLVALDALRLGLSCIGELEPLVRLNCEILVVEQLGRLKIEPEAVAGWLGGVFRETKEEQ